MANSEIIGAGQDAARRAPKKYKTILADPPWHYDEFAQNCHTNRVVKPLPYPSMSLDAIKVSLKVAYLFPVKDIDKQKPLNKKEIKSETKQADDDLPF